MINWTRILPILFVLAIIIVVSHNPAGSSECEHTAVHPQRIISSSLCEATCATGEIREKLWKAWEEEEPIRIEVEFIGQHLAKQPTIYEIKKTESGVLKFIFRAEVYAQPQLEFENDDSGELTIKSVRQAEEPYHIQEYECDNISRVEITETMVEDPIYIPDDMPRRGFTYHLLLSRSGRPLMTI